MNDRTEVLSRIYKPVTALIVYKAVNGLNDNNQFYLESHSINDEGQLMEGKPLLEDTLTNLVDVFKKQHKELSTLSGLIPENLLKYEPASGGRYKMIWYRPSEERVIHFANNQYPTGKAIVPAMVYMVANKKLYVYTLKDNKRPDEKTQLLTAPFNNIYDDCSVCLGSAKVKKPADKLYSSAMQYWEDLFWLSEFTGLRNEKKEAVATWRSMVKAKKKIVWTSLFKPTAIKNKTLKSIL